jgi:hypothetical protein
MTLTDHTYSNATIKLLSSADVKVFPCAYRGNKTNNKTFDPEARSSTEYNFVNARPKLGKSRESYVISFDAATKTLKAVIGGYYFELYNADSADFFDADGTPRLLAIKLRTVDMTTAATVPEDPNRKTEMLASWIDDADQYLDVALGASYVFAGLCLVSQNDVDKITASYTLQPFSTAAGALNWNAMPIDMALATDKGAYALRMLGATIADVSYSSRAIGDYSFGIGKGTTANGENSASSGETTIANGKNSFVGGYYSQTDAENSFAFGEYLKAEAKNQAVFGRYNLIDAAALFLVGNGTSENDRSNLLALKADGFDVNTALNVKGAIKASGASDNTLTLGSATAGEYGAITVYGEKGKAVFSASKTGDVDIAGKTHITGALTADGTFAAPNIGADETGVTATLDFKIQTASKDPIAEFSADGIDFAKALKAEAGISAKSVDATGSITSAAGFSVAKDGVTSFEADEAGIKTTKDISADGDIAAKGKLTANGSATLTNKSGAAYPAVAVFSATEAGATLSKDGTTKIKALTIEAEAASIKGNLDADGEFGAHNSDFSVTRNGTYSKLKITTDDKVIAPNGYYFGSDDAAASIVYDKTNNVFAINKAVKLSNAELTGVSKFTMSKGCSIDETGAATFNKVTVDTGLTATGAIKAKTLTAGESITGQSLILSKDSKTFVSASNTGMTINENSLSINAADGTTALLSLSTTGLAISKAVELKDSLSVKGMITALSGLSVSNATGTTVITLNTSGTVTAQSFTATSDIRKKTNVRDYACDKSILDLPVKEFEYISDETHTKHIGCIAQDLIKICPEIVHEDENGYLSIEESKLVYLLLQEVKSLKQEVSALKGA